MSLATSRKQIPASMTKVEKLYPSWTSGLTVLNYGCGKWPQLAHEHLIKEKGALVVKHYDPNLTNHFLAVNSIEDINEQFFDVVFVANVLNVLTKEQLPEVLKQIQMVSAGVYIFQIYEGNKSNVGGKTRDGYQRNAPTRNYYTYIFNALRPRDIEIKRNNIIVTM